MPHVNRIRFPNVYSNHGGWVGRITLVAHQHRQFTRLAFAVVRLLLFFVSDFAIDEPMYGAATCCAAEATDLLNSRVLLSNRFDRVLLIVLASD